MTEIAEAARRPKARFNNQYEAGYAMLVPHARLLKDSARLFRYRASAHLAARRPDLAWDDLQVQFRLAQSLQPEPILISHLVQIIILDSALQNIWDGLSAGLWTEPQWEAITRELARLQFGEDYQHCINGEALFLTTSVFDEALRGRWKSMADLFDPNEKILAYMPKGWIYQNKLALAKLYFDFAMPVLSRASAGSIPIERRWQRLNWIRCGVPPTIFSASCYSHRSRNVQRNLPPHKPVRTWRELLSPSSGTD